MKRDTYYLSKKNGMVYVVNPEKTMAWFIKTFDGSRIISCDTPEEVKWYIYNTKRFKKLPWAVGQHVEGRGYYIGLKQP